MKNVIIMTFLAVFSGGCVYTPKCTPPPLNSMDGPVSMIMKQDNFLYVLNSNADARYCSSYISMISLSSPTQPSYSNVAPMRYKGSDISYIAGAYLSSTGLLWLTDRSNSRILIFDTAINTITSGIQVDQNPTAVVPIGSVDGDQLMLSCNLSGNDVSIISSIQQKELYRIQLTNNGLGASPLNAVVTPSPVVINNQPPDMYAYIARGADNNISVVSINNHCEFNPMFPSSATLPVFNTNTYGRTETMSSVQTQNCQTKSEEWTLSFTPATSDFLVNGSVSGPMKAHARAGIPYTSDNGDAGFTIYDPVYPFVSGESFTFYTTASSGLINIPNLPGAGIGTATPVTKGIVMTPDMRKVFVSYKGLDSVVVIATGSNTVENYIKVGKSPEAMALSADGSTLYVACYNSNTIYVIDTNTESVIGRISVGQGPFSMVLSPDQHYLYELNYGDNNLDVIDLTNFTIVGTLK